MEADGRKREDICGLVLSGGRARRMGGADKALKLLAGRPLVAHVLARLKPQVGRMAINANGDPARFADFGVPVIPDPVDVPDSGGPLAGVLAGLLWTRANRSLWLVTAPCDSPWFPDDLAARLGESAARAGCELAIAAHAGRRHPVFGLWSVRLAEDLCDWLAQGGRKVQDWAESRGAVWVEFPALQQGERMIDPFLNINTPEDLEHAERLLANMGMAI
jgi:molybdopterin-guanine dinucleotide biosynthesis protein A